MYRKRRECQWRVRGKKRRDSQSLVFQTRLCTGGRKDTSRAVSHPRVGMLSRLGTSDSLRPHGLQPARLLCPRDSPGKNTGVGCHFLLQCMKVKNESEFTQSCPTLSDPMECSPPGSSVHGVFQARVLEWGAIAFM